LISNNLNIKTKDLLLMDGSLDLNSAPTAIKHKTYAMGQR